jgi:hypothetical protein
MTQKQNLSRKPAFGPLFIYNSKATNFFCHDILGKLLFALERIQLAKAIVCKAVPAFTNSTD